MSKFNFEGRNHFVNSQLGDKNYMVNFEHLSNNLQEFTALLDGTRKDINSNQAIDSALKKRIDSYLGKMEECVLSPGGNFERTTIQDLWNTITEIAREADPLVKILVPLSRFLGV